MSTWDAFLKGLVFLDFFLISSNQNKTMLKGCGGDAKMG